MSILPTEPISNVKIQEKIGQSLAEGFTGLVKIAYLMGEEVTLLVQFGQVYAQLVVEKNNRKVLPGQGWQELFPPSMMGHLTLIPAPGRLLMLELACFDAPAVARHDNLPNTALDTLFASTDPLESATIARIQWNNARAYVLMPGAKLPLRRAVLVGQTIEVDDEALALMPYWSETNCSVTLHRGELSNNAWIAIHLNILFEYMCSHMLHQYGYMTGKVMANSLARNLVFAASPNQWDISNNGNRIQDQTLFAMTEDAVTAYKSMLHFVEENMAAMIGGNFIDLVKGQALDTLNPFYINLGKYYGFNF